MLISRAASLSQRSLASVFGPVFESVSQWMLCTSRAGVDSAVCNVQGNSIHLVTELMATDLSMQLRSGSGDCLWWGR